MKRNISQVLCILSSVTALPWEIDTITASASSSDHDGWRGGDIDPLRVGGKQGLRARIQAQSSTDTDSRVKGEKYYSDRESVNEDLLQFFTDKDEEYRNMPVVEEGAYMMEVMTNDSSGEDHGGEAVNDDLVEFVTDEEEEEDEEESAFISLERRLDEANIDDAVAYYSQSFDDEYNGPTYDEWYAHQDADDDGWYEVEAESINGDEMNNVNNSSLTAYLKNKVQEAESTAWNFYMYPPSKWTSSQWDLVFALSFSLFAICCMCSACCAYCLMKDEDLEDLDRKLDALSPNGCKTVGCWTVDETGRKCWSPSRPKSSPIGKFSKFRRSRKSRKNRRGYDEDHYKQYQEEVEDTDLVANNSLVSNDSLTVNTNDQSTAYDPPEVLTPDSLVDYTSIQREKEARVLEAAQASENDKAADPIQMHDIDKVYSDSNPDWRAGYFSQPNFEKKSASKELDEALSREDKLLEARELKHNFIGYYAS